MSNSYKDLSILIPVINEKDNLKKLLPHMQELYPEASLYVLDDGSTDNTSGYIKELIDGKFPAPLYFFSRDKNTLLTNDNDFNMRDFKDDILKLRGTAGLSASVLDGLALVKTANFAVMDADFQHPPELIGRMREELKKNELVTAYRTRLEGFPLYRKLITKVGTFIARSALPFANRVKDPLSGAFAGRTEDIRKYIYNTGAFKPEGFKILFDLLKILSPSAGIGEAGYEFRMRSSGESKISCKHLWVFFKSVFTPLAARFYSGLFILGFVFIAGLILTLIYGDIAISNSFRAVSSAYPDLRKFFKIITDYGNPAYYIVFISSILYGIFKKRKKYLKIGLTYIMVQLVASIIITGGIKIAVGRPRPRTAEKEQSYQHQFFTGSSRYKSFPSGHTTDAFSSAGVLWMVAPSYGLAVAVFGFSLLIGISRVFVSSHYPLDVLAGMCIGFITGLILIYKKFR